MDPNNLQIDFFGIGPQLVIVVTALLVLATDMTMPNETPRSRLAILGLLGLAVAFWWSIALWGRNTPIFSGMVVVDNFALFFNFLLLITCALTLLLSMNYVKVHGMDRGEYYALLLLATMGMMLMAASTDLVTIFISLEIFSLALYVLSGFARNKAVSRESALKYFLLGAFASAFMLYGIALIYGAIGKTNLGAIGEALASQEALLRNPLLLAGTGLLTVGLGFKVSVVPFHVWTPDVYEGAPTSVTAFMSVATKAAGFAAFLRVFLYALSGLKADWDVLLWILAVLTMIAGNVIAVSQTNIKRMLAYSSIAHAGYVLVALVAGGSAGNSSALFYLMAYVFMNLGAFGIVLLLGRAGEEKVEISDYAGLGYRHPILGASMTLFLLSLGGIPPMVGFVGKLYIFNAAVQSGYVSLAIIGVLTSVVSVFYYLRVVVMMYMRSPEGEAVPVSLSPAAAIALIVALIGTIGLGITPRLLLRLTEQSVLAFL